MLSLTEENYLKEIYHLSDGGKLSVSTNSIAEVMKTAAASVTDMIKKLAAKKLLNYQKYQGVYISDEGQRQALNLIRKHRLWESFLVNKLKFNWDEVHEVAEQLEHIKSPLLIKRLDEFLGHPRIDPHGDPIPDEKGAFPKIRREPLIQWNLGDIGTIIGVADSSAVFLQYLDKIGVGIGSKIMIKDKVAFDGSLEVVINDEKTIYISTNVSQNLLMA